MGIQFENVTHRYEGGELLSQLGLHSLHMSLEEGSFIAVLGAPGSGKSTLIQHLNGLLLPQQGAVVIMDYRLEAEAGDKPSRGLFKKRRPKARIPSGLRKRVGLVFQFPEQQLFDETIEKDICFGPINFGASQAEALEAAREAAAYMGLDEELLHRSPFQVSGGQLRKAAIAAVLAADPEIIVLDEPTASLDQKSRAELMQLLHTLNREQGKTIIVVTHRLEEVLPYADHYVVMDSGTCVFQGDAAALIAKPDHLERAGIESPAPIRLLAGLAEQLGAEPPSVYMDAASTAAWIKRTMDDH